MPAKRKGRFLKFADRYESLLVLGILVLMFVELTVLWVKK